MLKSRQGNSVETLFFVMIFVLTLLGGVEISRAYAIRHAMDSGTAIAARQLSLDPSAWSTAVSTVQSTVNANFLGGNYGNSVSVTALDSGGGTLSSAAVNALSFGTVFRVRSTLTLTVVSPMLGSFAKNLQVEHWSIIERYP